MRILVTRPRPGGAATAERLRARGYVAKLLPLLETVAVAWAEPVQTPDAIMLTSAGAPRLAGAQAACFHRLPAFAVGAATAAAARVAGFADVRDGGGTVQALVDRVAATGMRDVLHLGGADRTAVVAPAGLNVIPVVVYRADLVTLTDVPDAEWVVLYSVRTAAHFAAEAARLGIDRDRFRIAALAPAIAAAAGTGWGSTVVAGSPSEDALLAAIDAACHKPLPRSGAH